MKIFQGWPFLLGTQTATPAVSSHDLPFVACVLGHPPCVPVSFSHEDHSHTDFTLTQ